MTEAQEITRKAKSNLAFTLLCLPKENRDDVTVFYAFCRRIDDIADDPDSSMEEKVKGLDRWQALFLNEIAQPEPLEQTVLHLQSKHSLPKEYFLDLIEGCRMDLAPQRFQTWPELQIYTHRVASTVGLVCLPLFGATHPDAGAYAEKLGHALQLTNILRDVSEDLDNGERIYLPIADLERFGYSEADLLARTYDSRFQELMAYQANRANGLFKEALDLFPHEDRKALLAAEIMGTLYQRLLEKMEYDKFRVFEKRYSLSKGRKIGSLVIHGLRSRFSDC